MYFLVKIVAFLMLFCNRIAKCAITKKQLLNVTCFNIEILIRVKL